MGSVHLPPAGLTRDSFAWRSSLLSALFDYSEAAYQNVQLLKLMLMLMLMLMLRVFVYLIALFWLVKTIDLRSWH